MPARASFRPAAIRRPAAAPRMRLPQFQHGRYVSSGRSGASATGAGSAAPASRMTRFHGRLPRFLQRYTRPLLAAPLSHVTSFLLLHEITAVVPLFGLAYAFHYTHYLPPFFAEGKWVADGVERFARWFRKKGWLGAEEQAELDREAKANEAGNKKKAWLGHAEGGVRWVVEFATAYAITKALLPLRLLLSVSATPWFARVAVIPATKFLKRLFGRGKSGTASAAKKTGSS